MKVRPISKFPSFREFLFKSSWNLEKYSLIFKFSDRGRVKVRPLTKNFEIFNKNKFYCRGRVKTRPFLKSSVVLELLCKPGYKKPKNLKFTKFSDRGRVKIRSETKKFKISKKKSNSNFQLWEARYIHPGYKKIMEPDAIVDQACPDVYDYPLLSERYCKELIEEFEGYGKWSDGGNKVQ